MTRAATPSPTPRDLAVALDHPVFTGMTGVVRQAHHERGASERFLGAGKVVKAGRPTARRLGMTGTSRPPDHESPRRAGWHEVGRCQDAPANTVAIPSPVRIGGNDGMPAPPAFLRGPRRRSLRSCPGTFWGRPQGAVRGSAEEESLKSEQKALGMPLAPRGTRF